MNALLAIEFAALAFLLSCSAFFSSAETAMFSLNTLQVHRLRRSRPATATLIEELLAAPTRLLSTVLIGNTLVNVAAAALGFVIAERLYPARGEIVAIPVMTVVLLLFGEVAPKRLAMARPDSLSIRYAPLLKWLIEVLAPLRALLENVTRFLQTHLEARRRGLTEDEFLTVVEVGEEEGVLDKEERTMVDGIIRLEETQASDVMTPRVDLVGIDLDDPVERSRETARSVTFRYLPVYRGSLDEAEGFLEVPRFLLAGGDDLESAMIPPFFVPETAPLDTLLATFQQGHRRVAYVVDEFGGTAGLITRGDILEEIVADVDNEYGEQKFTLQQVEPNRWLVDGSTSLEDVNYELDLNLEAEGADRIAGWVIAQAERIPKTGEEVEAQGCRVSVQRVRHNRVALVLLEKTVTAPGEEKHA
jgi:putative hemolysin